MHAALKEKGEWTVLHAMEHISNQVMRDYEFQSLKSRFAFVVTGKSLRYPGEYIYLCSRKRKRLKVITVWFVTLGDCQLSKLTSNLSRTIGFVTGLEIIQ